MIKRALGFREPSSSSSKTPRPHFLQSSVSSSSLHLQPRVEQLNQNSICYAHIIHQWVDPRNGLIGFVLGHQCSHAYMEGKQFVAGASGGKKVMKTIIVLRDVRVVNNLSPEENKAFKEYLRSIPSSLKYARIRVIDKEVGLSIDNHLHCLWRGDIYLTDGREQECDRKEWKLEQVAKRAEIETRQNTLFSKHKTKEARVEERKHIQKLQDQLNMGKYKLLTKDYQTISLRAELVQRGWVFPDERQLVAKQPPSE